MKPITCFIVDDEPPALAMMEQYVKKTPFLQLIGKYGNGIDALQMATLLKPQVVFLDIQMPELNGVQVSRILSKDIRIIFTTAFSEFALEGFKVDALDYLLKPFDYDEFLKAATKARDWFQLLELSKREEQSEQQFIFVKSEYKQVKVDFNDVYYFEGLKDYVKIHLKSRPKPILSLMSLKSLEELLPPNRFMRVHRSYIIGLHEIESLEKGQVIINGHYITIADQYKEKFNHFVAQSSGS